MFWVQGGEVIEAKSSQYMLSTGFLWPEKRRVVSRQLEFLVRM